VIQIIKAFILGVIGLAFVITASLMTPQLHNLFLRDYVGSKVFRVLALNRSGGGTGFVVEAPSGKSYIISNAHVCRSIKTKDLLLEDNNGKVIKSEVVKIDEDHDLCLIKAPKGYSGLTVSEVTPRNGLLVYTIGYPLLGHLSVSKGEVLKTEVTLRMVPVPKDEPCKGKKLDMSDNFMYVLLGIEALCEFTELNTATTNMIYRGNSGSPNVDIFGRVVGVAYLVDGQNLNLSFNVPVVELNRFLKDY
jgi:S1-C subfamily serine protease